MSRDDHLTAKRSSLAVAAAASVHDTSGGAATASTSRPFGLLLRPSAPAMGVARTESCNLSPL
eukprot:3328256-Prymnesium_polylepis.1